MMTMHLQRDQTFPNSHQDQLEIYELHTILIRRGRFETERLSANLEINRKIREVAKQLEIETRFLDRRAGKPEVTLPSECVSLNRPGFED